MSEKALEVLEFGKVLARMAAQTAFSASHDLALELRPTDDVVEVARRLQLTTEARRLLDLKPNAGVAGARDVRAAVQRAALGGVLDPQDLLDIRGTLASGQLLRQSITRLAADVPLLADLAQTMVDRPALEGEIARCINERAEVADAASSTLAQVRGDIKIAYQRLTERLNDILASSTYRPYIQDTIITMRDGRYVIPIKAEAKGQFRGIVHDQSSSGATLFIEPLATVDLNNRWRQYQIEEQHEIARILRELSGAVAASAPEIVNNVGTIAEIDLALAKAKYAAMTDAVEPEIAGRGAQGLDLYRARHPLLISTIGKVVPIDVRLGDDFRVLVVTGPNTGGKTVALKTIGLLTLMAQAGLHIPAGDGSRVRVFRSIFADIGDEQSIEQSLSTFSSHLRNIVEIVKWVDDESLVLLDEVGAGTDPTEGSALARAILSHLLARGACVAATTHYSELKVYAHDTAGVQNASVEFDVETLAPTYRLSVGLPGRSNALAIATRLGLQREIIDAARVLVRDEDQQIETLLAGIQAEKDRAAAEREVVERERRHADEIRRVLAARLANIDEERERAVAQTRAEARRELDDVRELIRAALASVDRSTAGKLELLTAQREVREAEEALKAKPAPRLPRHRRKALPTPADAEARRPLELGDLVLVRSLAKSGELLSLPDDHGQAEVRLGTFKLKVAVEDLEKQKGKARDSEPTTRGNYATVMSADRAVGTQLDLRGWRAEEVATEVDRYLDDAYVAGMPFVRLIHGKGTGVLREIVRDLLKGHPLVKSYEAGGQKDGGEGVTVVKLAV